MIKPIFTVEEALQADNARRNGKWDDPVLAKLGELSVSIDVDVQRIWLHTDLCCQYLNLTPDWIRVQSTDKPWETDREEHIGDQLEAIWKQLCFQQEKALQTVSMCCFDDPAFDTADFIKIPFLFRGACHHGKRDPYDPRVPRLFEPENGFNSFRSPEEGRVMTLMKRVYEVMHCNDPGQAVLKDLRGMLRNFGVDLTDIEKVEDTEEDHEDA